MAILVIDAGTSGIHAAIVDSDGHVTHEAHREVLPTSPAPGLVEFDADDYAAVALELARGVLATVGSVDGVGVSTQRATTVVWDRATGRSVAPAQSWQDLRTVGECLALAAEGLHLAPNQSATKLASILDAVDAERRRDLCFGTIDSWLIWQLTDGRVHATDATNAGVTGLVSLTSATSGWDGAILQRLRIPESMMGEIRDSSDDFGAAVAVDGAPRICGVAGDQQASLVGQGCVTEGSAKATFGTGAMLDVCLGTMAPRSASRSAAGTFPIVCWRRNGATVWGLEAIMLSAGTNVQWLRDDLGIIADVAESAAVAAGCDDTGGVVFVPAQVGLGTPQWDYGARGLLIGLTRGTGRPHVVRAVLEGVARRAADLLDAAESDSGLTLRTLRIDGGMSANTVFRQALADAIARPVEVAPVKEATTLGAAFLAGLHLGTWSSWEEIASLWRPAAVVEPRGRFDRDQWSEAVARAGGWYPELSALDF